MDVGPVREGLGCSGSKVPHAGGSPKRLAVSLAGLLTPPQTRGEGQSSFSVKSWCRGKPRRNSGSQTWSWGLDQRYRCV